MSNLSSSCNSGDSRQTEKNPNSRLSNDQMEKEINMSQISHHAGSKENCVRDKSDANNDDRQNSSVQFTTDDIVLLLEVLARKEGTSVNDQFEKVKRRIDERNHLSSGDGASSNDLNKDFPSSRRVYDVQSHPVTNPNDRVRSLSTQQRGNNTQNHSNRNHSNNRWPYYNPRQPSANHVIRSNRHMSGRLNQTIDGSETYHDIGEESGSAGNIIKKVWGNGAYSSRHHRN